MPTFFFMLMKSLHRFHVNPGLVASKSSRSPRLFEAHQRLHGAERPELKFWHDAAGWCPHCMAPWFSFCHGATPKSFSSLNNISTETYGDLGISHFNNPGLINHGLLIRGIFPQ